MTAGVGVGLVGPTDSDGLNGLAVGEAEELTAAAGETLDGSFARPL
jgi:hypothetical protein